MLSGSGGRGGIVVEWFDELLALNKGALREDFRSKYSFREEWRREKGLKVGRFRLASRRGMSNMILYTTIEH